MDETCVQAGLGALTVEQPNQAMPRPVILHRTCQGLSFYTGHAKACHFTQAMPRTCLEQVGLELLALLE